MLVRGESTFRVRVVELVHSGLSVPMAIVPAVLGRVGSGTHSIHNCVSSGLMRRQGGRALLWSSCRCGCAVIRGDQIPDTDMLGIHPSAEPELQPEQELLSGCQTTTVGLRPLDGAMPPRRSYTVRHR